MRAARIKWQKELGMIDESWPLSPRDEKAPAWDTLSAEEKDRADHIMAIYAAMIDEVDQSVGRMIKFLKERNQFENTLFIFLSDNGGCSEGGVFGRLISKNGGRLGGGNSSVYVGACWANFSNTPFRKFKKHSHEGGSATPFIACWPDGFKANPNWITTPGHVIDILPTLADIAGARYPSTCHGQEVFPADGVSLEPLLTGTGGIEPRPLYWSHCWNAAVRVNDRKLVKLGGGGDWELYDMKADRTEIDNLVASRPEEVQRLQKQWDEWANEVGVFPKPKVSGKKKGK